MMNSVMIKNRRFMSVILACSTLALQPRFVHAGETPSEQFKDRVGDTNTDAKKAIRKQKRKIRKATGNDSLKKDVEDHANDVKDDVSNSADKLKRKMD